MARSLAAAAVAALAAVAVASQGGCLYDPDDVCGPDQALHRGVCVCVADTVPAEDGGGCEPVPAGLGAACDPDGVPCSDQEHDHCRSSDDGGGYCTSTGCASSDDCSAGYACAEDGGSAFCQRPPTGLGTACESSADCAGYEASYCETYQVHTCLVAGCTRSPDSCFEGWECCDLSSLGLDVTLCVEEAACPTG